MNNIVVYCCILLYIAVYCCILLYYVSALSSIWIFFAGHLGLLETGGTVLGADARGTL